VRQLSYVEPGVVRWEDVPEPELTDPEAVLVRPLAVARCDLDVAMATFGLFPGPYPVGHEAVAEVFLTGASVSVWRPGDRVLVPFQVSCGRCPACASGRFAACHRYRARSGAAFGFGPSGGGHGGAVSDLLLVPAADHMLLAAPAGVPAAVACTLPDNVVDAYRCVAPPMVATRGVEVLVVGGAAASIGLYVVAFARGLGAAKVRYVDTDAERCAAAERLGADVRLHEGSWPARFDRAPITIDNTGDAEGLSCTIRSTDDFGTCTSVAPQFAPATPVPLLAMYTKGITFHVSRADSRRFLPEVAELVANGIVDPATVPTTVVPWDQADRAWLEPAIKLVIDRGAES
jgi:threonine dehydrogenase-like Zn-dependent dehydrogenase